MKGIDNLRMSLKGNVIAQSQGEDLPNLSDKDYFQAAIKTNRPFVGQPRLSEITGKFTIFMAAPVKDTVTNKTIAVLRTRIPLDSLKKTLANFETAGDKYHLIGPSGKLILDSNNAYLQKDAEAEFSALPQLQAASQAGAAIGFDRKLNTKVVTAYAPFEKLEDFPELKWKAVVTTDPAITFAPQKQLLLTEMMEIGVTLLLVGAIAVYFAHLVTRRILAATNAVEKLGQGELETFIAVEGEDELATLAFNINRMSSQLRILLQQQEAETERAKFFAEIASFGASNSQDLEAVLNKAVIGARETLKADRVVIYSFNPDWSGYVAAESVAPGWPKALANKIEDPCIGEKLIEAYRKGRVVPTDNVFKAGFAPEHLALMERLQIKASLVTPIVRNDQLFGLLIAHHCHQPHNWQQSEINFLTQLAAQLGLILDRVTFLEQLSTSKEQLQARALELLMQVEPISKGDLTIRANVTADEIGTIADSYNATVASLRKLVTQVQTAATIVAATTSSNEISIEELSTQALRQTQEITTALDRIEEMSNSIRAVAKSAQQAQVAVQQATGRVQAGDAAMNRTVDGILAIRETVAQTSKKVKRLGESSQKISKVVSLIGTVAEQTNLLALNAAIEAANAGEQGRGFAVVAGQVRSLASQSTQATAEIENLVKEIQTETNEVVAAMEAGTQQVVTGTKLVDETRQSLNQIAATSAEIGGLVSAIASATVSQSQASEAVTQTMTDVAAIAQRTSTTATVVSASFEELLAVAQELQANVDQFKVS